MGVFVVGGYNDDVVFDGRKLDLVLVDLWFAIYDLFGKGNRVCKVMDLLLIHGELYCRKLGFTVLTLSHADVERRGVLVFFLVLFDGRETLDMRFRCSISLMG